MMKIFKYCFLSLIFTIFTIGLLGCTGTDITDYDFEDVVAIVRGEEITVEELRFLYSDEEALEILEDTIKIKLAIQEAKLMDLNVSEEEINQEIQERKVLPPRDTDDSELKSVREFAEKQVQRWEFRQNQKYFIKDM